MAETPSGVPETVATIRSRFLFASTNEAAQRTREVADLQFDAGQQWPKAIRDARSGADAGQSAGNMPSAPPRPCLVIDKLKQPIRQVENQARSAKMSIEVSPKSDGASEELAKVYQGVVRQIEYESRAQVARMDAFSRAVKCGRGFYRILIDYANDKDTDQDIIIKRILNQANVYLDPTAEEPDWSDALWAIIATSMTWETYKKDYPTSKLGSALSGAADFRSIGDNSDGWIQGDSEQTLKVRVAEYFEVQTTPRTVYRVSLPDPQTGQLVEQMVDALPDGVEAIEAREVDDRKVVWYKTNGSEILDQEDWPGIFIPIIPVIGEELFVPDETDPRRWQGIIRPARDAQIAFNYMVSAKVEAIGNSSKAPWLMAEGQAEGYEDWWQQAANRSMPYLYYKTKDLDGNPVGPPQRDMSEPPIQALTSSINDFDAMIKATTGIFDPSLGNLSANERSGKAILALQRQADVGTSNFMDNFARAIAYEGKVIVDLIPHVYGNRPGRVLRMLTGNDETKAIMVGQPFVPGPDGAPQPAHPNDPNAKHYDLSTPVEMSVIVEVGKGVDTAREETREILTETVSAAPQLLPAYIDLYFKLMGQPLLADRAKLMLPPQIQQALAAEKGDQNPALMLQQTQTQLQQAMEQMKALSEELNAKNQIIETETIKAQQQAQLAEIKTGHDERIAAMNNQTKLAIESMKAENAKNMAMISEAMKMIAEAHGHAHQGEVDAIARQGVVEDRDAGFGQAERMAQMPPPATNGRGSDAP